MESFSKHFLNEATEIISKLDCELVEKIVSDLARVRDQGGRLFFLGVGGSAGNCNHAVNDFRKLGLFEAYAPTDNVSELTARTNDEGWETVFVEWLKGSRLGAKDAIFVLSVGGGNKEKNVSANIVNAIELAKSLGTSIFGIVGKDGGHTAKSSDTVLVIPVVNENHITPHTEAFQGVIWHLLISHPLIKKTATKWESIRTNNN
jgi:D-sedoheptulose 7-phosphate isomerase